MKKQIFLLLFIILFSACISSTKAVQAEDNTIEEATLTPTPKESTAQSDNKDAVVINEEDVAKLKIDESITPSEDKIVPPPAPTPPSSEKEDQSEDNRSWTKFTHKKIIAEVSEKYNVDPQVIYATIMTESEGKEYAFRYEPKIKDASFCMGQILLSTARRLGFEGEPKEMYKPEVCIDLIGKYYRMMLDKYGDLNPEQLARAYNTGSPFKRPVLGHLFRFRMWYNDG